MSSGTSAWRSNAKRTVGGGPWPPERLELVGSWAAADVSLTRMVAGRLGPKPQEPALGPAEPDPWVGSMEQGKTNTMIAGIDVGKRRLDAAVHRSGETTAAANTAAGVSELIAWLRAREVGRVGLEATGGYERAVRLALEAEGFEVVIHQPLEVRLFARLKRLKAKNDRIDAQLIAAATAQVDAVRAAADPRLAEQKTFMEHVTLKDVARLLKAQIGALERLKARLLADLLLRLKAHADLKARLILLMSLPGVGPVVAASLVIRMPELAH